MLRNQPMGIIIICMLFLSGFALNAEDLTTRDGKVYRSYMICGTDKDGIQVVYKESGRDVKAVIPPNNWPDSEKANIEKYLNEIERKKKEWQAWLKTPAGKKYLEKQKREAWLKTPAGQRYLAEQQKKEIAARKKKEQELKKKAEAEQKRLEAEQKKRYQRGTKAGAAWKKK